MREIESFEMELCHVRELGDELVTNDNNLARLIESQLNGLDDSCQMMHAGAHTTHVCSLYYYILLPVYCSKILCLLFVVFCLHKISETDTAIGLFLFCHVFYFIKSILGCFCNARWYI